jgi:hypothetical protein
VRIILLVLSIAGWAVYAMGMVNIINETRK